MAEWRIIVGNISIGGYGTEWRSGSEGDNCQTSSWLLRMNRNENAIGRKRNQKQLASFTNFTVGPVSFDGSEGEKTKKKTQQQQQKRRY